MAHETESRTAPALGKLVPPYPVEHCANADHPGEDDWPDGAYLYRDLVSDKLVCFCGDCARYAELAASERFKLIAL
jgi:hypothetical protein